MGDKMEQYDEWREILLKRLFMEYCLRPLPKMLTA